MKFKLQFDMYLSKTIVSTPFLVSSPLSGRTDFWGGTCDGAYEELMDHGLKNKLLFDYEGSSFYAHIHAEDGDVLFYKGEKGFAILEGEWWDEESPTPAIELDTTEFKSIGELSLLGKEVIILDALLSSNDLPVELDPHRVGLQSTSFDCEAKKLACYDLEDEDRERFGSFFLWQD